MKNTLIVVSLLDGKGPTGVEAHFNQLIAEARVAGIDAALASAYPAQCWWATLGRKLIPALRMVHTEYAEIFSLWLNCKVLVAKLTAMLAQPTEAVTLYAQDPVSTHAALQVQRQRPCHVVMVVHYNTSQADELLTKGAATANGPLCRFLAKAERKSLPCVDHLIFVSDFMHREVTRRVPSIGAVPQSVIPNFAARVPAHSDAIPVTGDLIAIGTLEPRKNQAFLLHVLARAAARGHVFTLTIVGDGPDHGMLVCLAAQLGLQHQVTFAGFQSNAGRLIARHRLLVHAAVQENLPITLVEALAAGRPILAAAVGGIPEMFQHGVEGYFWPLDNIDAAATLLINTLHDAATYRRLAQAARARYDQHFDCDRLLAQWLAAMFVMSQAVPQRMLESVR